MSEDVDVYQFIAGHYNNDGTISVYGRNKTGVDAIIVSGFDAHFYIPTNELDRHKSNCETKKGFKSIYGDDLTKVVTVTPSDVGEVRDLFSRHYEADIPFIRRLLINTGITSGFSVPKGRRKVHYTNLKPVNFQMYPRFMLCDLETDSLDPETGKILMNCVYDRNTKIYLSIVVHPEGKVYNKIYSQNHKAIFVSDENKLIELTKKLMIKTKPDVFSSWNVKFDKGFIEGASKRLRIKEHVPFKRTNNFDFLKGYKTIKPKASDKLADVMEDENLVDKVGYEPFKIEYWKEDIDKAVLINKSHVKALVELNEKYRVLDYFWEGKNLAGFEDMSATLWHSLTIDLMLLRKYYGKWILPSNPSDEEVDRRKAMWKGKKTGGMTIEPEPGLYDNQGNFDMSRFYSGLLIAMNLSPEPHEGALGVAPQISIELNDRRAIYDKELLNLIPGTDKHSDMKLKRKFVKFATESLIGYFGSERSRLFEPERIYNKVTQKGQKGLKFISDVSKGRGYSLTYGDTDGIMIGIPLPDAIKFVDYLNEQLKLFSKQEGIDRDLTLKLDRYYKRILFCKKRDEDSGAKKKYAGRVTFEDNKEVDYLLVRGFEYIRRDASLVTKKIQHKLFDVILKEEKSHAEIREDLKEFLKEEIRKMKKGIYSPDEIAIPKTIHMSPNSYPKPQDYIRGAVYANNWLGAEIKSETKIKMLYVKSIKGYPKTDVISVPSKEFIPKETILDMDAIIDKTIRKKVEEIIMLVGLNWEDIVSRNKSL